SGGSVYWRCSFQPRRAYLHGHSVDRMSTVIDVDHVWKKYRLGIIGTGTLRHDFERWWHRVRGKPDPYAKVEETANRRTEAAGTAKRYSSHRSAELSDDEVWALRGVSF